jgi:hypothetical protein
MLLEGFVMAFHPLHDTFLVMFEVLQEKTSEKNLVETLKKIN